MCQSFDGQSLLHWYDATARVLPWRVSPTECKKGVRPDPYPVWLSEIMLQQTSVSVVSDYFSRFFQHWTTVESLATAPLEDVLKKWAGLGYYARARNLHACARQINQGFSGIFPQSAKELAKLPGIGPYTSAAIAAICFDEKIAVVDGNVERVVARFCALKKPVHEARPQIRKFVQALVPDRAGDFAQSLMDLGATICTPRTANCDICPLGGGCAAKARKNPLRFPLKAPRKTRPIRFGHAFVMQRDDGAVWLCKRAEKGLLARMSEVPGSEWRAQLSEVEFPTAGEWALAGRITHVFTHFRLELDVWQLSISGAKPPKQGWWCSPDNLAEEALPSVFRKVLATAGLP